ncbi:Cytoplasmic axial filament protein CafA and Ribonuclease G [Methylophaga frappieri]|uniref:Ribonuclease G n=1 Tax=Methylophaga frappieri (strain ATCC BAA-2434 / DSM 25690 / JAM7) TaxID=754477 RepID=I1YFR9_METFJ|nr:ribonuclease G [Methylophaga frappieri]AFJ01762.1 Cytoplasmic axial filament protein CafA and Ribonuclease G [Methylophaga frappieri]
MSSELLINVTPSETRAAVVENGVLQEVFIERSESRGLVGNIYKGKVCRVLPGMQAAFVEIGLPRAAFLHASDISIPKGQTGDLEASAVTPPITSLLREGQELMVQVIKDPMGTKGARLTTQLSVSSRYLVYMPEAEGIGISLKIEDEAERERLKQCLLEKMPISSGGYIMRTAAEGGSEAEIAADLQFLHRLWQKLTERRKQLACGEALYEDLPLALRALRDLITPEIERIRIDAKESYQAACHFADSVMPECLNRLEWYPGPRPLFDLFSVEDEIQKALERKVLLKSGGYLIFDQTEAMTTIDVNTGGFVGHKNLEETIFKTNLEAAHAIARQLRVRNLGGIIIIDFIDMIELSHREQVLRALEQAMQTDRAKHKISAVSELGLVEMTRKRTRESLGHILCEPCPSCQGRGYTKNVETVCYEIFREILRESKQYESKQFLILASQDVIDRLNDEDSTKVAELEQLIGKPILFQCEPQYGREQYNVVLM